MSKKTGEQDVLNLLTSLKRSEGNYPSDLIQARRDSFTKQAAAMAVLARAGLKSTTTTGSGQAVASSTASSTSTIVGTSIGKILETALVVAIVAEAGAVGYIYRNKIADFINSKLNPKVETVASPPPSVDSQITEEFSTETPDGTETDTPVPFVTPDINNNIGEQTPIVSTPAPNNNTGATQVASTPAPTDDTPGLHLGQTKQPTNEPNPNKEPNNNGNTKKD